MCHDSLEIFFPCVTPGIVLRQWAHVRGGRKTEFVIRRDRVKVQASYTCTEALWVRQFISHVAGRG